MAITSNTSKVTGLGNGAATVFSFSPMVIYATTDLKVTHVAADGTETVLTEGTGASNYSVAAATTFPGTGSITYPANAVTPMASGEKVIIQYNLPFEQLTVLNNITTYFPKVLERQLDKVVQLLIQINEIVSRAFTLTISDTSVSSAIPTLAGNALKFLRVKSGETGVEWAAASTTAASASDVNPLAVGTAAATPGTNADFAREDHVHQLSQQARTAARLNLYYHGGL